MALICEAVFWPLIVAVKPSDEKHVLDVLPVVWPRSHAYFTAAAAAPARIVDGSLKMELGVDCAPQVASPSQVKRSERSILDMQRIRRAAAGDALVEQLVGAAMAAMAKATANHAAEWLPAGLEMTNGKLTMEGKLCAACITPSQRARYDALCATSIPVERLHALGRVVDDKRGRQRADHRAGDALALFNKLPEKLLELDQEDLQKSFNTCRRTARRRRRQTIKQQLVAAGRAKREEREAKLSGVRAKRDAKKQEEARIQKVCECA